MLCSPAEQARSARRQVHFWFMASHFLARSEKTASAVVHRKAEDPPEEKKRTKKKYEEGHEPQVENLDNWSASARLCFGVSSATLTTFFSPRARLTPRRSIARLKNRNYPAAPQRAISPSAAIRTRCRSVLDKWESKGGFGKSLGGLWGPQAFCPDRKAQSHQRCTPERPNHCPGATLPLFQRPPAGCAGGGSQEGRKEPEKRRLGPVRLGRNAEILRRGRGTSSWRGAGKIPDRSASGRTFKCLLACLLEWSGSGAGRAEKRRVENKPPRARRLISPSFSRLHPEMVMRRRTSVCPCDHMGEIPQCGADGQGDDKGEEVLPLHVYIFSPRKRG